MIIAKLTKFPQRFLYTTLAIFFSGLLALFAQKDIDSKQELLAIYKKAQSAYEQAAQTTSKVYDEKKEEALNNVALSYFRQLNDKLKTVSYDSLCYFSLFKTGELLQYFYHDDSALQLYEQAISVQPKTNISDSFLFQPLLYCGIIYYSKSNLNKATDYFKKAESIQNKYSRILSGSERLFNSLGALYYETGDYKAAKNYFTKAAGSLSVSNPYYKDLLANYTINLASTLTKLESFPDAINIYLKLVSQGIYTNEIYHNLGTIYLSLKQPQKALSYLKKVHYTGNFQIRLYNDMSNAYFLLHHYDSCAVYLKKAEQESNPGETNISYGTTLKYWGDLMMEQNDPKTAINYFQKAIHQFYPAYNDITIAANPTNFTGFFSYINLFHALTAKAAAWHQMFTNTNSDYFLQQELATYQSALALIDYVEKSYNSDEARLFLSHIKYELQTKPIEAALQLYEKKQDKKFLETAFYFDQKNKSATLAYAQYQAQTVQQASGYLQKKEAALRTTLSRLSIKGMEFKRKEEIDSINNLIRDAEINLNAVQTEIKEKFKDRETNKLPTIEFLQQQFLDNETAIISYHFKDDSLLQFIITKKDFSYQQVQFNAHRENLQQFIRALKNPDEEYQTQKAKEFDHQLIPQQKLTGIKHLIIIPDEELCYLPFEALQSGNEQYLVEQYKIQYQYNTALLHQETTNFADSKTLGLAPFVAQQLALPNGNHLGQLQKSSSEFKDADGLFFVNSSATKDKFLQQAKNFEILHIASHAVVDDSLPLNSFIAFSPQNSSANSLLYAQEIYNLSFQKNKLVLLSACETGNGTFVKSEGIMSLSRAFAFAGCPNIITTLWQADDASTAYLMQKVHGYLNDGKSIDEAVQQAKIDFLKDKKINPRQKLPYYWAHVVFIGNYKPQQHTSLLWLTLFIIPLLALIVWLIKKPAIAGLVRHRNAF